MNIDRMGSFYAGGKRVEVAGEENRTIWFTPDVSFQYNPNGIFHIEPCYVQFMIPTEQTHSLPVVLVHGGGMCGAVWESTPDGRPGWQQRLLEAGFATYVVDNVERGRAGFNAVGDGWPDTPLVRSERESWELFRFGPADSYERRAAYADCQFPVDHLENLTPQNVPRWTSTTPAATAALEAALKRIGPAIVIAHSQGGAIANTIAMRRPDLVRAMVGIEASGFPEAVDERVTETHWLWVLGDHLDHDDTARFLESGAQSFDARLRASGANSTVFRTTGTGKTGNTHLMMMDRNSDEIVSAVVDWLKSVPAVSTSGT